MIVTKVNSPIMNSLIHSVDNLITFIDKFDTDSKLKVISFNTLADCYALSNSTYPNYCCKQYLNGNYRLNFITNILTKQNADIIALQEVDKPELIKLDNKKYKIFYQIRPNKKQDGLLLAFNQNKFCTYSNTTVKCIQLNDLCRAANSENSKVYYRKSCIALYLILTPINSSQHAIIVVNTHLYYHRDAADIRLRQTAYIMNIIHSKCSALQTDKSINNISIIFCGDLNALPHSAPFEYLLNGSFTMKATNNSMLKLIMDAQLNKLCRWCRSLGVDTECFYKAKLDKINIGLLFEQTKIQDRILVTRSKKLVQRKQCPKHLLLAYNDIERNLKEVVKFFKIEYKNDDDFYSRCTICNGELKNLKKKEILKNDKIPNSLKDDIFCSFWECLQCERVIWFGLDENGKTDKMTDTMEIIMGIMTDETDDATEDDEKNKELGKRLALLPNLQRFFWEDVVFDNPFGDRLKCGYMEVHNGMQPKYTNKVYLFEGCLDYIIYGNIYDRNNKNDQSNLQCINTELIEGNKEFYPNKTWPSDHILLVSTFELN